MDLLVAALCFAVLSSISDGEVQRIDPRFVGYELPSLSNNSYSSYEWNNYIEKTVNITNVDEAHCRMVKYLEKYGVEDAFHIPSNIGGSITMDLATIPGLCSATLTLHSLGNPVHRGSLFYPDYNAATRRAIAKIMAVRDYTYSFIYALMNQVYESKTSDAKVPLYRGLNARFSFDNGSRFRFDEFASATVNESLAMHYLGEGSTLFQFINARGIPMNELSQFPTEGEYLIHPFEYFTVANISQENFYIWNITRVVLRRDSREID